jgi:hypothetical protein
MHLGITFRGFPWRAAIPCRASLSGSQTTQTPAADQQGSSPEPKSPSGLTITPMAWTPPGGRAKCQSTRLLDATASDFFDATETRERGPSDSAQIAEPCRILAGSKSELLWTASRRSSGPARFRSTSRSRPEAFIAVNSISRRARAQDANSALARKLEVRSLRDARDQRREPPGTNFRLAA